MIDYNLDALLMMLFEVLDLIHNLVVHLIVVFRWVAVVIEAEENFLVEFGFHIVIAKPVCKGRLGINEVFYFLRKLLALVVDNDAADFFIFSILEIMHIAEVHKNIIERFLLKGQA